MENDKQKQITSAIIVVGLIIAGAILLKGSNPPAAKEEGGIPVTTATLTPVSEKDNILGNPEAKIAIVIYADFQCPFCGAVTGLQSDESPAVKYLKQKDPSWAPYMSGIMDDYVKNGKVKLIYRNFAFLGPESQKSAEAAKCAGEQGKFWEYHDYLFSHQAGENEGAFADPNLKLFAKELGLDSVNFDKCLDEGKHAQAVTEEKTGGSEAGVTGTPKGFIVKDGGIAGTIDGAESYTTVKPKIEEALK